MNNRLAQARAELLRGWQQGARPSVEDVLRGRGDLADDADAVGELAHLEAVLRQAGGEPIDAAALGRRFPRHAAAICQRLGLDAPGEAATLPPTPPSDSPPTTSEAATIQKPPDSAIDDLPSVEAVLEGGTLRVPGYEILSELGRGGMGVVYKARHVRLRRLVALKMILAGGHAGEAEVERFRTEAEAIARLRHPGIVQIYDIGDVDVGSGTTCPYFSLEFCPGGSLAGQLDDYRDPRDAARLLQTLAEAMQAAHAEGVIHRDLKPGNILLTDDGSPKITDFGLARMSGDSIGDGHGKTRTGTILGTPDYMAPEQAAGKVNELGPASDVYSLGAILYECLAGRPPLKAATVFDTILMVIEQEPVPLRERRRRVPRDLETICMKCLRKRPEKRYRDAGQLAADLKRFLNGEPIRARPMSGPEQAWHWARRHRWLAVSWGMYLVFGGCCWAWGVMGFPDQVLGIPTPLAVPGVLAMYRVTLAANLRVAGAVFALLGLPALAAWALAAAHLGEPSALQVLVPIAAAGCLAGMGWSLGRWAAFGWASALAMATVLGSAALAFSPGSGPFRPHFFGHAFLILALHGVALGLTVRLVLWGLARKPAWIIFAGLIGATIGSLFGLITPAMKEIMQAARPGTKLGDPASITLHAECLAAFVLAILTGLMCPYDRAAHGAPADHKVPSTKRRRTASGSQRSTSAGQAGES